MPKILHAIAGMNCRYSSRLIKHRWERTLGNTDRKVKIHMKSFLPQIYLKLENLQPTGSFKHRGSCNAIRSLPTEKCHDGVYTASAGNFGQGLAWNARHLKIPCSVIVPDTVPQKKLDGLTKYGATIHKVI